MDNKIRAYIYAFLSRIYSSEISEKLLVELKANEELLRTIGDGAYDFLHNGDEKIILRELGIEYNSLFVMNNHPIESSAVDAKNEILVGLQNPVTQFYVNHGYDLNLEASHHHVPDHIAIEFGFMQKLILQQDTKAQMKFYNEHLMSWIPPYLIAIKDMSSNPFYIDLADFTIDFMLEDYSSMIVEAANESA
jgi:TorA maturation chaperone TorD